jgi:hypothetical protein
MKLLVVGIVVFVVSLFALVLLRNSKFESVPMPNIIRQLPKLSPSSTPFAFQELTIPYLRNREYKSSLGERKQAIETESYIGYLTSYNSDGLTVYGLLTIPKGDVPEGGYPALVFVHGYIPPQSYRTLENYNSYVDYLAKNGFVVLRLT